MHPALLIALLTALWGLAPTFGSPASLWVMPLVALVAAWWSPGVWRAVGAALAGLVTMALLWSLLAMVLDRADALRQLGTAGVIVALHAPFAAALAAGARWGLARWEARRAHAGLPQA